MRISRLAAAAAVPVLFLGSMAPSHADDVSNDLDTTIDAVAESMALNVGGSPGTTDLYVKPLNGDGKPGCNLSSGQLTLSVSSSDTSVATVSPGTVTFTTGCGDTPTLTVTPVAAGGTSVTVAVLSNTTGGSFNLDSARFDVEVAGASNTAPVVDLAGVTAGAAYDKGAVPDAICMVSDAEDGNSSFAATLSAITGPYAVDGIGSQTASCSYTDGGGLTASASATFSIVDPTAPDIGYTVSPASPDGDNGWYRSDVSVDWTVTEEESPSSLQTTGCDDVTIEADQGETSYTCSATGAGGTSEVTAGPIKRDATDPSVDVVDGPQDGASYYWGSVPAAPTCSADDVTSGVTDAGCTVSGYSTAVGSHTVSASATDNAGNSTTVSRSYQVLAWTLKGFYAPVDMGGVFNVVKGGSTVPLKFEVFAGSELTSTAAVKSFTTTRIACNGTAPQDTVEIVSTGGTSLRYDATAGQFIQNWKTPTTVGACYSVKMTTMDGSSITAFFKLK
ncbi:PxKF domain-containing protein [Nocardioides pelophilus]|uniref:PxKF domain-containing protein n=1 Tax=Nocardioides pelophilus TaxID=2172019 RepID=UPI00160355AF|nr:PxKF domain-containing protein [Nocardioides pelophilus]